MLDAKLFRTGLRHPIKKYKSKIKTQQQQTNKQKHTIQ